MDDIAVLIPCYNEDKTIEKVVSDFKRVLPDAVIYVYDNNSTDDTEKLAKKAGAIVRHEYQHPVKLQPFRAKNGCASIGFLHDMGSRVFCLDVADLTVNALLCRRDTAIAIDVHASPFWLKDNERHF